MIDNIVATCTEQGTSLRHVYPSGTVGLARINGNGTFTFLREQPEPKPKVRKKVAPYTYQSRVRSMRAHELH